MDYIWDVNELSNVSGSGTRGGVAIVPTEVKVDGVIHPQKRPFRVLQRENSGKFRERMWKKLKRSGTLFTHFSRILPTFPACIINLIFHITRSSLFFCKTIKMDKNLVFSTFDPRLLILDFWPSTSTFDPRLLTLDFRTSTLDLWPSTLDRRPSTLDHYPNSSKCSPKTVLHYFPKNGKPYFVVVACGVKMSASIIKDFCKL
jgi:hypothetical protein